MRSIFLVPAGDAALFEEALASVAEAVAIDVASGGAPEGARMMEILRQRGRRVLARIDALTSGVADSDLDAVMAQAPYGIILPQACGGRDVQHLGAKLAVREAENALEDGATRILAAGADLPEAIFALGTMARATRRLIGLVGTPPRWPARSAWERTPGWRMRARNWCFRPRRRVPRRCWTRGARAGSAVAGQTRRLWRRHRQQRRGGAGLRTHLRLSLPQHGADFAACASSTAASAMAPP